MRLPARCHVDTVPVAPDRHLIERSVNFIRHEVAWRRSGLTINWRARGPLVHFGEDRIFGSRFEP